MINLKINLSVCEKERISEWGERKRMKQRVGKIVGDGVAEEHRDGERRRKRKGERE